MRSAAASKEGSPPLPPSSHLLRVFGLFLEGWTAGGVARRRGRRLEDGLSSPEDCKWAGERLGQLFAQGFRRCCRGSGLDLRQDAGQDRAQGVRLLTMGSIGPTSRSWSWPPSPGGKVGAEFLRRVSPLQTYANDPVRRVGGMGSKMRTQGWGIKWQRLISGGRKGLVDATCVQPKDA